MLFSAASVPVYAVVSCDNPVKSENDANGVQRLPESSASNQDSSNPEKLLKRTTAFDVIETKKVPFMNHSYHISCNSATSLNLVCEYHRRGILFTSINVALTIAETGQTLAVFKIYSGSKIIKIMNADNVQIGGVRKYLGGGYCFPPCAGFIGWLVMNEQGQIEHIIHQHTGKYGYPADEEVPMAKTYYIFPGNANDMDNSCSTGKFIVSKYQPRTILNPTIVQECNIQLPENINENCKLRLLGAWFMLRDHMFKQNGYD